jgi:hypothetical protein
MVDRVPKLRYELDRLPRCASTLSAETVRVIECTSRNPSKTGALSGVKEKPKAGRGGREAKRIEK